MTRPLRIAMIGAKGIPATVGGVERIVEELSARLASRGHAVTVYCRAGYSPRRADPMYRGIRLRWTPTIPGKYSETLVHTGTALLDAMRCDFDILHVHSLGNAPLLPFARLQRARLLFHLHGQEWRGGKWGRAARAYFRACERPALAFPHRVVVLSRVLQDYCRTVHGRDTLYVPNAVEVTPPASFDSLRSFGVTPGGFILAVGRLVPEKGLDELIDAHRRLAPALPLVIAGDSSHSDHYADELRRSAGPGVIFPGVVTGEPLAALYAGCRLLVQASHREGMPLVVLEAMAHGAPVVASDLPEHRETLGDGGHFFRTGDADDLLRLLKEIVERPDLLAERAATAAARIASDYSWPRVVDRMEEIYAGLVGTGH